MPEKVINARAPTRLSFAGGGTDVNAYFEKYGGCVVNYAINLFAYSTLTHTNSQALDLESADLGLRRIYEDIEALHSDRNDNLLNLIAKEYGVPGIKLFARSEFPAKSGIGGSATLSVSSIGAFHKLLGKELDPMQIAKKAYEIERIKLSVKGGWQDQLAATYGGFNFMEFSADGIKVTPLKLSKSTILELEKGIVLAYVLPRESGSSIHAQQEKSIINKEQDVLNALHKTKELAYVMRDFLVAGDTVSAGELLHKAWQEKKKMSQNVTNAHIDQIYDIAVANGALGGKVSGAGGGGHMFFICKPGKEHLITGAIQQAGAKIVPFKFSSEGLEVW